MTAVVVQSRLGSTRLPGKALLPLGGATLTDQVLRRLGSLSVDARVLATDEESAAALGPVAARNGFELLVGPAEDVLGRYCLAIRRYGIDLVLRATGDNPLVSAELAALLLERRGAADPRGRAPDYAAFVGMPLGMGVELVSAEALLKAEAEASLKPEREHVCPYLYDHPEMFAIDRSEAPPAYFLPAARITVDTRSDYEAVLRIYGALYDGKPVTDRALLDYLRSKP
ncbi:MAG TPA: NTP transferase domain-containing protein [Rectinemataceae bacterium]|nr:NTP transferase domain-containing protein [Rectinemataceae bacterium]